MESQLTPPSSPPPQVLRRITILSVTLYAKYSYHQKSRILLEKDYSLAFSREQTRNRENRFGRESSRPEQELKKDLIVKREFRPAIPLSLILYLAAGLEAHPLMLFYITISLLFGLENLLGYLHITVKFTLATSCVVPSLQRVPRFEPPIHVPRPHNPSPYVRGPHVILEDETDQSLSS